jgi:hypothetical protein
MPSLRPWITGAHFLDLKQVIDPPQIKKWLPNTALPITSNGELLQVGMALWSWYGTCSAILLMKKTIREKLFRCPDEK